MANSILPQGTTIYNDSDIEELSQPSKTYKVDFDKGEIVGFIDDIEALKQAIKFILSTERYEYLIYSWDYGIELKDVIGKDKNISESEFKRRIKEALIQDNRINNVDNFIFNYDKDSAQVQFTVFSIFGEFQTETVVSV